MKLNGWLRLWVVLSLAWLIVVASLAYLEITPLLQQKQYEVSKEGVGTTTFVFSASDPEDFVHRYINEELVPKVEKTPQEYIGRTVTTPYDSSVKRQLPNKVAWLTGAAFVPPLALLLMGFAFAWVKRGFRQ